MNDFERDVERMLHEQVSDLPDAFDAPPAVVARARRRRTVKAGVLALSVVVVVAGGVAAIAGVAGRDDAEHVTVANPHESTTTMPPPTTTARAPYVPGVSVPTRACPVLAASPQDHPATPATTPRAPAAGDPARFGELASFAGMADARYVVLGPKDWSCLTELAQDGDNGIVIYPPKAFPGRVPQLGESPISVDNDWLWHGLFPLPCQVSTDPAVLAYAAPVGMTCALPAGRTLTRVDDHTSTFVDADGTRGAAWMKLPSSAHGADGLISVLTCRPTAGLATADCQTIIADYVAAVSAVRVSSPGQGNP